MNLFAADSLPGVQFIPLNSLTESIAAESTDSTESTESAESSQSAPSNSSVEEISLQTLSKASPSPAPKDSVRTPYGLPQELLPIWDTLSIKQKAAQMVMVYMSPVDFIVSHEFGGVLVTGQPLRDTGSFKSKIDEINSRLQIPLIVATDQEGGVVNRLSSVSKQWERLPSARDMRRMDSVKIYNLAHKIAQGLNSVKVNMNLAPVLDPSKDYRGKDTFMEESKRSWGADTANAYKVRAFVKAMSDNGIICVSKHFPGYDSWTNSDHQIAVSATSKAKIAKNVEFFRTLAGDIPVTMVSSVRFIRISNRPAVFEPKIVKMARAMSPEMVILTDDLWGVSLRAWVSGTERVKSKNYPAKDFKKLVRTALVAGNDMFMITYPQKAVEMVNYLAELSRQSDYYTQRIEESAARILKMKYKTGLFGDAANAR